MRLLVWGAGAIGGTVGAYLVRAGHDVTFVDIASEHVAAINDAGLRITGPIDSFTVRAPAFTPADLSGEWDTVLLCTKAQHTEAATRALLPHLTESGYVVSVQNGLNEKGIAALVGTGRTVGSFVNFGADYLEPGAIHYGGRGAVVLGELDGRDTARLNELHGAFLAFDDRAVTTPNIWGYLWGKMAYGAVLFATALTDASIADALAHPDYGEVFTAIAEEVLRVAAAEGVRPEGFNGFDPGAFAPGAAPGAAERSLAEMIAFNRRSAKTHSGIYRDLAVRKRKTEVDAQLGAVVTVARAHGLETPLTEGVIDLIHALETGERGFGFDNLDLLETLRARKKETGDARP